MLRPRYLIKRFWLVVVFAFLAAVVGVLADVKSFRLFSAFVKDQGIRAPLLAIVLGVILLASFVVVHIMLDPRYATSGQAAAAALLFLVIYDAASLAGFWFRLRFLPDPSAPVKTAGTTAFLSAAIVICLGGSGMAMLYNALFVQKTDYTKFRAEVKNVVSSIGAMEEAFRQRGYLTAADAETLKKNCLAAHTTGVELVKIELPIYGAMIESRYVRPLEKLARAANGDGVSEAPESFLRACGLIGDDSVEQELSHAFRELQNGT